MEAPSGGPEDRTPPEVTFSYPGSLATGVGSGDSLVIVFSERMDRGSVEDWLFLSPEAGRLRFVWVRDSLTIFSVQPWREETTYVLLIASQARDRRRNPLSGPMVRPFSTGDRLDAGVVEGTVRTGRLTAAGAFVFAWENPPTATESTLAHPGDISDAIRRAQVGVEGEFRLGQLPVGVPLSLCCLYDSDENRSYDPRGDLWGCLEEVVVLEDSVPALHDAEIYLVYDDEPGSINGRVVDSLCAHFDQPSRLRARRDSLRSLLGLVPPAADSAMQARADTAAAENPAWKEWESWVSDTTASALTDAERASADSILVRIMSRLEAAVEESAYCARPIWVEAFAHVDSAPAGAVRTDSEFTLGALAPGTYWVRSYRDMNFDRSLSQGEPVSRWVGPFTLRPARRVDSLAIALPVLPRPWPTELLAPPRDSSAAVEGNAP